MDRNRLLAFLSDKKVGSGLRQALSRLIDGEFGQGTVFDSEFEFYDPEDLTSLYWLIKDVRVQRLGLDHLERTLSWVYDPDDHVEEWEQLWAVFEDDTVWCVDTQDREERVTDYESPDEVVEEGQPIVEALTGYTHASYFILFEYDFYDGEAGHPDLGHERRDLTITIIKPKKDETVQVIVEKVQQKACQGVREELDF